MGVADLYLLLTVLVDKHQVRHIVHIAEDVQVIQIHEVQTFTIEQRSSRTWQCALAFKSCEVLLSCQPS